MSRLSRVLAVSLLASLTTVLAVPVATAAAGAPAVIAHRGSSGVVPENTLAAVRQAVRHRADVVENDIQRTKDGELVIVHDTTLARTTDVEAVFPERAPWNVGDFTLAEIKRLDAGSWFAPEFAGERVPTLREWGEAVGARAKMLLEPKAPELYPGIEKDLDRELRTVPVFRAALRGERIVVQSFNHPWLRGYHELAPEVPVGLLFGTKPTATDIEQAAAWADQVNPAFKVIDEATVDLVHGQGMEIHVWTVNDGQGMRTARNWGVDGIITNYPQVLRDLLRD
ncbi:glycerophosphodiester phosphodiesterase family protein [Amycolatopsis magusensis]|uniref:Glycerophosphoryl diester phosphodiesterase n=1 Tax=Amycolatopsis magusensis TaxID=882444 RepID=A0ABS4PTQ7_9PSEU|nr:glycerophosphodiester phosphodiesterase family protein [Amycolatopsis magusensis]MBP2182809.1 glycerophosphoryl diester phosphodiesterase [Amycolatopsis magusensis]